MGVVDSLAGVGRLMRVVLAEAREERLSLVAAGLAYHLLLFFVPLVLLALMGLEATDHLVAAAHWLDSLSETRIRAAPLRRIAGGDAARVRAAAIAGALVLWSAARAFQSLNSVFSDVSETGGDEGLLAESVEVLVVLATWLGTLVLYALATAAFATTATDELWYFGVPVALFFGFFALFYPVYYVFPPADVSAVDAMPGALFAAVVWAGSGLAFRLYAEASASIDLYGVVGVALLVMTWFYVGGLALLVGVVLNGALRGAADGSE